MFQEGTDTAGPCEDSNIATQGRDRGITFGKNEAEQQSESDRRRRGKMYFECLNNT